MFDTIGLIRETVGIDGKGVIRHLLDGWGLV